MCGQVVTHFLPLIRNDLVMSSPIQSLQIAVRRRLQRIIISTELDELLPWNSLLANLVLDLAEQARRAITCIQWRLIKLIQRRYYD